MNSAGHARYSHDTGNDRKGQRSWDLMAKIAGLDWALINIWLWKLMMRYDQVVVDVFEVIEKALPVLICPL